MGTGGNVRKRLHIEPFLWASIADIRNRSEWYDLVFTMTYLQLHTLPIKLFPLNRFRTLNEFE